jgi:hypothetical protein
MSARRRVAIFAADVVGYCSLMGVDEVATLKMHRRWAAFERGQLPQTRLTPLAPAYQDTPVETAGTEVTFGRAH